MLAAVTFQSGASTQFVLLEAELLFLHSLLSDFLRLFVSLVPPTFLFCFFHPWTCCRLFRNRIECHIPSRYRAFQAIARWICGSCDSGNCESPAIQIPHAAGSHVRWKWRRPEQPIIPGGAAPQASCSHHLGNVHRCATQSSLIDIYLQSQKPARNPWAQTLQDFKVVGSVWSQQSRSVRWHGPPVTGM